MAEVAVGMLTISVDLWPEVVVVGLPPFLSQEILKVKGSHIAVRVAVPFRVPSKELPDQEMVKLETSAWPEAVAVATVLVPPAALV